MCGIVGYYNISNTKRSLEKQLSLLHHRGPDANSESHFDLESCSIGFGHTRLSIIDLQSRSNQPFESTCNKYVIVFNGEIYNYQSLKTQHLGNENLKSTSDTEVILALYIKYGIEFISLLKGMFSFAILDKEKKSLICARDPLGIKPFYYYKDKENFIFSSEIKPLFSFEGIKKEFDSTILPEYLLNSFLYEPSTGYKNIHKLRPGHIVEIQQKGNQVSYEQKEFWNPTKKLEHNFDDLIQRTISEHLISDVPVGLFFSGGVDSSVILTEIDSTIKLFMLSSPLEDIQSSGFENDQYYAQEIAKRLGVPVQELKLHDNNENLIEEIEHIAHSVEEPIADYTFIASQKISKVARENGYKVMLSGMGADEIFAGYPRYSVVRNQNSLRLLSPFLNILKHTNSFSKKVDRLNSFFREEEFELKYTSLVGYFSTMEVTKALDQNQFYNYKEKLKGYLKGHEHLSPLKKAMLLDIKGFLAHNFSVADKSSMLESIELRVPLATPELFNYAVNLNDNELIKFFTTKLPLKKHLEKKLPKNLIYRKKTGFNPPLDNSIKNLGFNKIKDYLRENKLGEIISTQFINTVLKSHFQGKSNNTYKIYSLLFLCAWYKQF